MSSKTMLTGASAFLVAILSAPICNAAEPRPIACGGGKPKVTASTRMLGYVPYRYITVSRPMRTIIRLHGGPDAPALGAPDALDCYMAKQFNARIIKPAYFGSSERAPWRNVPHVNATSPLTRQELAARLLQAIKVTYAGMPQSVREVQAFIRRWDGDRTVIVGESHGGVLAALSANRTNHSRIILLAPAIPSKRAFVRAAMRGRYVLQEPIDPPRLVLDGKDVTDQVFVSRAERNRALEAVSLAYYRPWQDMTLDQMLKRSGVRAKIIVGLRDRIGMIGPHDWTRFKRAAPKGTELCADPKLAHEPPMMSKQALRCFQRYMRLNHRT